MPVFGVVPAVDVDAADEAFEQQRMTAAVFVAELQQVNAHRGLGRERTAKVAVAIDGELDRHLHVLVLDVLQRVEQVIPVRSVDDLGNVRCGHTSTFLFRRGSLARGC